MRYILFTVLFFCFLLGCNPPKNNDYKTAMINDSTKVELREGEVNKLTCLVSDSITSEWLLRYPVYQYDCGDINHDGTIDLAVGVFKATRYDSVKI